MSSISLARPLPPRFKPTANAEVARLEALHIVTDRNFDAEVSMPVGRIDVVPVSLPAVTAASVGDTSQPPAAPPQTGLDLHPDQSVASCSSSAFGVTGLVNLGNTCYINTIIQCFLSLPQIRNYYISDLFLQNLKPTGNFKKINALKYLHSHYLGFNPSDIFRDLAIAFCKLARTMWSPLPCETDVQTSLASFVNAISVCSNGKTKHNEIFISPASTLNVLMLSDFRGNLQHDAQEFASWLLVALHESEKPSPPSMLASLFRGTLTSSLNCSNKHCGYISVTPNEFSILTLHFPKGDGLYTLEYLLKNFVAQEPLTGDNIATCRNCGHQSASSKTLSILTAPLLLLVHLKRFHSDGRRRNNPVSFPLHGLRLPTADTATAATSTYDCVAISHHYGAHYTALAQRGARNSWFYFNDLATSAVPQEPPIHLRNTHAYLLFYIRRAPCISHLHL